MPYKPRAINFHKTGNNRTPRYANRLSARERGYTTEWDKASKLFRQLNPLCVECEKNGILTPSQVVDHVIPHKGNDELFWDEANWAALCKACHDKKTGAGQ